MYVQSGLTRSTPQPHQRVTCLIYSSAQHFLFLIRLTEFDIERNASGRVQVVGCPENSVKLVVSCGGGTPLNCNCCNMNEQYVRSRCERLIDQNGNHTTPTTVTGSKLGPTEGPGRPHKLVRLKTLINID